MGLRDDIQRLRDDEAAGVLTEYLLGATPCAPDGDAITVEILRLDQMIDAAVAKGDLEFADTLGLQFRALNWARSGSRYYAPPSESAHASRR